jgi:hypothetical protein
MDEAYALKVNELEVRMNPKKRWPIPIEKVDKAKYKLDFSFE